MEQLEDIYESQLFERPKDPLNEKLTRVHDSLKALMFAFMSAELQYNDKIQNNPDFYTYELDKLKGIEQEFFDLKEKFEKQFIKNPHLNHPNRNARRDIHG